MTKRNTIKEIAVKMDPRKKYAYALYERPYECQFINPNKESKAMY